MIGPIVKGLHLCNTAPENTVTPRNERLRRGSLTLLLPPGPNKSAHRYGTHFKSSYIFAADPNWFSVC